MALCTIDIGRKALGADHIQDDPYAVDIVADGKRAPVILRVERRRLGTCR